MSRRYFGSFLLAISLALVFAGAAFAAVTGSILGVVRDKSDAVVAGAKVTAVNKATNVSREATSGGDGLYRLLALPPGTYTVTAAAPGFQQFTTTDIDVKVNDELRIDVKLEVGAVRENVVVAANAVQVETESTQLGGTLETQRIMSMPLNGRSYLDLLTLQAGVAPITSGTINNDRPVSGMIGNPGNVSVNGQPESANAFLVNGGDVNEGKNMGAGLIPNLDSIQEFRLISNSYDAEYGKFSGAVMNAITKSGANGLHGDAFEFLRNDAMDARNFFDPTMAELRRNQFGYAVGGPFVKNKLFWFTDYQGTRQTQGASTGLLEIPTQAQKQGQFDPEMLSGEVNGPYWAKQLSNRLGYTVTDGEPYTSVFPNGVIPSRALDPIAVNELKYFPAANVDPVNGLYANSSAKGTVRDDKMGQRVDFANQKTGNWSFYYHYDESEDLNPLAGQAYSGAPAVPGFPATAPQRAQMFVISDTKTFSPTMVNEARGSIFRTRIQTAVPSSTTDASLKSFGYTTGIGTLGINPSGPAGYPESLPPLTFNTFSVGNNWLNMYQGNTTYMGSDVLSKVVANHMLKFGGDFRFYMLNVRNICGPNGSFSFNGQETGSDFADFLLGAPSGYVQCSEQFLDNRSRYGALFAQDSWKVKPNLTLNFGVRWDVSQPWADKYGQVETFVAGAQSQKFPTAPTGTLVPGDPGVPSSISPTQWDTFAPRIGLAYSPNAAGGFLGKILGGPGKTSIRASYGIYYLSQADMGNFGIIGNAPFGLYWASSAPPVMGTPFQTRSDGSSQGVHFPFTFPTPGGDNSKLDFTKYFPMYLNNYAVDNKLTTAEHYNLTIQRELTKTTVLTLAYVGTQTHHLLANLNLNVGNAALCQQLNAQGATPQCGPGAEPSIFTLPNGNKVYGTMQGVGNQTLGQKYDAVVYYGVPRMTDIANSNYNSFQATVERKAADVTFLLAYSFAKSIDNASGNLYPTNYRISRVLSPFDISNNFVASYTWNIPFQRAFGSLPRRLTDGWTVTGITRFSTGFPITLSEGDDHSLSNVGLDFPNVVGQVVTQNPRNSGPNGPNTYFLPGAFKPEAIGQTGNSAARFFHGPGIVNTDFGMSKVIPIRESMSIQLRGEFFNIFNHANFSNPVGNITSGQFGQVTSAMAPRIGQLSAKFIW